MLVDTTDLDQILAPGFKATPGMVFKGTIFPDKKWEWRVTPREIEEVFEKFGNPMAYLSMQIRIHRGALAWFRHYVDGMSKADASRAVLEIDPQWLHEHPKVAVLKMKAAFAKYELINDLSSYFKRNRHV